MRQIELTKGYWTLVDEEDYQKVIQYNWSAYVRFRSGKPQVYAIRSISTPKGRTTISLHRWLLAAPKGTEIDHRNGNGLDNRRINLRLCTSSENSKAKHSSCAKSGYKGVSCSGSKWIARIRVNYKEIYLGTFTTARKASIAYNRAAKQHFGEFAVASRHHNNTK